MTLKDFKFGIEIEMSEISKVQAVQAVKDVIGGRVSISYNRSSLTAPDGRIWKAVNDGSIRSNNGEQTELVSPILKYDDIPALQNIIRALRRAGGKVNSSTGIHIHVDAAAFNGRQLANLAKIFFKQEELIIQGLGVDSSRLSHYTKRLKPEFIAKIDEEKPETKKHLNRLWYGYNNTSPIHYDGTRYQTLNLHSVFQKGTIEFRLFNSTLHAGKIKAYIQFCLAIAAKAHNARCAQSKKRAYNPSSSKYDLRVFLLRLNMIGDEFKTARLHLLNNLGGDSAFKSASQRPRRAA